MNQPPDSGHDRDGRPRISTRRDRDAVTVTVAGDIDFLTAGLVAEALHDAITGTAPRVVVDVAEVDFVDVAGLRTLLRLQRHAASLGVGFTLRHPRPGPALLLEYTGTADLLLGTARPEPEPATPLDPGADALDTRERRADERERALDRREERIHDRELLADERQRLIDERHHRVRSHEQWEDIREDLADQRELDLERRESQE